MSKNKTLNIIMFLIIFLISYHAFAIPSQLDTGKTKTILAGSRTPEQNLKNQLFCSKLGGVDMTNDSDVVIGENTIDATFCQINESNGYISELPLTGAGVVESDGSISYLNHEPVSALGAEQVNGGTWRAEAANSTVPMGKQWIVWGSGFFNDIVSSTIFAQISVPDFNCSATNSKTNFTGNATLTARTTCGASQGRVSTKDYASACVNGSCVQNIGTIFFR